MQALMQVNADCWPCGWRWPGCASCPHVCFERDGSPVAGGGRHPVLPHADIAGGRRVRFLKNVNPLTLFDYYGLAAGDASAVGGATLAVGAVALFAVAVAAFDRRDLSI